MTSERIERRALARRAPRGSALALLGVLMLGAMAWLPACQEDRGEEAIEELQDEAHDAKKQIQDEVDDHT